MFAVQAPGGPPRLHTAAPAVRIATSSDKLLGIWDVAHKKGMQGHDEEHKASTCAAFLASGGAVSTHG